MQKAERDCAENVADRLLRAATNTLKHQSVLKKIHLSISIFEEMTPVIAGFANVHLSVRREGLFIIQKKSHLISPYSEKGIHIRNKHDTEYLLVLDLASSFIFWLQRISHTNQRILFFFFIYSLLYADKLLCQGSFRRLPALLFCIWSLFAAHTNFSHTSHRWDSILLMNPPSLTAKDALNYLNTPNAKSGYFIKLLNYVKTSGSNHGFKEKA